MPVNIDHKEIEFVVVKKLHSLHAGIRGKKAKLLKWHHDDVYSVEIDGQEFVLKRDEFNLVEDKPAEKITLGKDKFEVLDKGDFLFAVKALNEGKCDYIFGPEGGLVHIGDNGFLLYDLGGLVKPKDGISFTPENYLGEWKLLKEIKNEN